MPPWHADPRYGKFANDRRLTQDERDTLLAWIDAGAPEGGRQGPAAAREVRPGLEDRRAGQGLHDGQGVQGAGHRRAGLSAIRRGPRLQGRRLGAGGRVPSGQPQGRPSHPRLHPGTRAPRALRRRRHGGDPGRLGARRHARHLSARTRPGKIPAGSKLLFEVHYTPDGTEQTDRSSVGIIAGRRSRPPTPSR